MTLPALPPQQQETTADWRTNLTIDDRRSLVWKIVSVLKECVTDPIVKADDARLNRLAAKFEDSVFMNAENKKMYFNDIAKKMYYLHTKSISRKPAPEAQGFT